MCIFMRSNAIPPHQLPTHMSTKSTHLLTTNGTAILFNQDIHQVRVPITRCQQNRCPTSLQRVETFTVGDGGMQGQITTRCYIRNTQHGHWEVKQRNPNPSSCTASTIGASTSHVLCLLKSNSLSKQVYLANNSTTNSRNCTDCMYCRPISKRSTQT